MGKQACIGEEGKLVCSMQLVVLVHNMEQGLGQVHSKEPVQVPVREHSKFERGREHKQVQGLHKQVLEQGSMLVQEQDKQGGISVGK